MDKIDVLIIAGLMVLVAGIAMYDPRAALVLAGVLLTVVGCFLRWSADRRSELGQMGEVDAVMRERGEAAMEEAAQDASDEAEMGGGEDGDVVGFVGGQGGAKSGRRRVVHRGMGGAAAGKPRSEAEQRRLLEELWEPKPRRMGPPDGTG